MPFVVEYFIVGLVTVPRREVPIWLIHQLQSHFSVGYHDAGESNALPDMPQKLLGGYVGGRPVLNLINSTCNRRKELLELLLCDGSSVYLAKGNIIGRECAMVSDSF